MFSDLNGDQLRQAIDLRQVYGVWREVNREWQLTYQGSMFWRKSANGGEYLTRRSGSVEKGLGPRSQNTEYIKTNFDSAKMRTQARLNAVTKKLDFMAPVNKAMGITRVPVLTAKILRMLDQHGLLGKSVIIVGSNALYAYESRAGVWFDSSHLATVDIDLLCDVRSRVSLSLDGFRREGMIGLLQKIDRSFQPLSRRSFSAVNNEGFMVDLIRPMDPSRIFPAAGHKFSQANGDLEPVEVDGLSWLSNSPKFTATVIGEDGYPAPIVAPDPRYFAIHKAWIANRADRDPTKKRRDYSQAKVLCHLITERFPDMPFDGADMKAIPSGHVEAVRPFINLSKRLLNHHDGDNPELTPKW